MNYWRTFWIFFAKVSRRIRRKKDSDSDSVDLLYYELHIISLNRGGSYIDSPEWLKNKKETINPKNDDDKHFQYALSVALNHEQMKKDHKE